MSDRTATANAANNPILKILPYYLGFGWVVINLIIYFIVSPIISEDQPIRIGISAGFAIASLIADVVAYKIIANSLDSASQNIENSSQESENDSGEQKLLSGENWIGPDGTESGPDVPEDWYITYNGPAPIVQDIYGENYGVDRGDGAVPIDYYIKKWGVPEGFGKTDHEKLWSME